MRFIFASIMAFALATPSVFSQDKDCDGSDEGQWRFMTCTWSLSECAYSCPRRSARKVEEDPVKCGDGMMPLACYCWDESSTGE